ncbi:unnamed protein product [Penicillium nalgiovense]|nr:unnamed protein product [Penicillium nalgiovense]CRL30986.1 unnamed protein product [Penicillium camemberti]
MMVRPQRGVTCVRNKRTGHDLSLDVVTLPESFSDKVPFRAQHLVLQAVQKILEQSGFRFVQHLLPQECHSFDWECAESMELHKLFPFLDQHKEKICFQGFRQILIKLHRMRGMVTSIRHAAVHRIVQDRKSFLGMLQTAVAFTRCIGDDKCTQQLGCLCISLDTFLAKLNERSNHLQERIRFQISLCQSRPKELMQRRVLLPNAIKKVTEQSEQTFNLQVQEFVRKNLC